MSTNNYKDHIYLDNKLFQFTDRKFTKMGATNKVTRSLDNSGHVDFIGSRKGKFTFTLDQDSRGIFRLDSIFALKQSFTLTDWDSQTYTVVVTNDYSPSFNSSDNFTISIDLEEL